MVIFYWCSVSDIDECASSDNECVKGGAQCKNTARSYKCICESGYFWAGTTCEGLLILFKSSRVTIGFISVRTCD